MAYNQRWNNMNLANEEKYDPAATQRLQEILYRALEYQYPIDWIRTEIINGADPHLLTRPASFFARFTPLDIIASYGDADFIQELFAMGLEPTPYMLIKAVTSQENLIETIDAILDANPDLINVKGDWNEDDDEYYDAMDDATPLLLAIRLKVPLDVIEHLLKRGADPNLQNNDGHTALMLATRYSSVDNKPLIELLLQYGADPELQNKNGRMASNHARNNNEKNLLERQGGGYRKRRTAHRRKRRTAHHRKRRTARKHKTHRRRR